MQGNTEIINSIDRALDILILLYNEQRELGVTEIGSSLGLYKSTVYRTLATLENKGFVQQNSDNGKYWLGVKLYALGMVVGENMPLKHIIQPYAKSISEKFNEVVNVSMLDINCEKYPRSILILKEESQSQVLKVNPAVGSSSECYCSAVGKCLLAFSSKEIIERYKEAEFSLYTKNTIQSFEQLLVELDDIRIKGYAMDSEEQEIGLTCVASPILDKNGKAIAAISISGPTARIKSRDIEVIIKELKTTSDKISILLK